MPDVKDWKAQKDPSMAEGSSCEPSQEGQAKKDEHGAQERPSGRSNCHQDPWCGASNGVHCLPWPHRPLPGSQTVMEKEATHVSSVKFDKI